MIEELRHLIAMGGPVMWPLLGLSVAIWAGLGWRAMLLQHQQLTAPERVHAFARAAATASAELPGRGIQPALCRAWLADGRPAALAAADLRLRRQIALPASVLRAMIQAAPLLGLLGTVSGMITLFQTLASVGTSRPELLADGISQALLTTQVGLLVALPAMFVDRRLARRQAAILHGLDQTRLALLQAPMPTGATAGPQGEPVVEG